MVPEEPGECAMLVGMSVKRIEELKHDEGRERHCLAIAHCAGSFDQSARE
jgi:hypothetical protein